MKIAESELIINEDGSAFHLHIKPEELAQRIILVGDPGRVDMLSAKFSFREAEGQSREFKWCTGLYKGVRMTILSTGIGTDNIDIVMTELDALANIDFCTREIKPEHKTLYIVRLGTCGAIQPEIPLGAYILSDYSVGFDGLMNWYANRAEITDENMESAFVEFMNWPGELQRPYFIKASDKLCNLFKDNSVKGMTISSPGFYGPQGRVVRLGLVMPDMLQKIESFSYEGRKITNFEMEGSAIAGFAKHLGHEAVTICYAIAHRYNKAANTNYKNGIEGLIELVMNKMSEF